MKTNKRSIAIVGGGLVGMTLALRLSQQGFKVTLIEAAARTGGLASPCKIGDYIWDQFYHVILLSDSNLLDLLKELNLSDQIHWGQTKTGFYADGHLYSMSNIMEFLAFPPLNLTDRLRLGLTIFYASKIKSWERLEAIFVTDWLTHLSGIRTFKRVWLPLLKSKLGENYKLASASFIWAIIARMYAARRSGLKSEMFGYIQGGYATILDRFQKHLDEAGVVTRCQAAARKIINRESGVILEMTSGESLEFDKVILTVPCTEVPNLCPQLSVSEKQRLRDVTYQGVICAAIILRRSLAGYYITNITDDWVPFTGVIEMTALVDKENFDGNSLVYLPCYLAQEDLFWQKSDAEIQEVFLAALESMYESFRGDDVLAVKITRARHVLPITTLNYSRELLPLTRTSLDHVFIVNSAQIPNGTMNVNESISLANRKAEEIGDILTREGGRLRAVIAPTRERSAPPASNHQKPLASLSMDLDNQWSYMKTHGDAGWETFPSYLDILIPYVLDILDQLNLRITFFCVGQDAALEKNRDALRMLTERSHEVGNHSFHHEPWLHLYPKDQIEKEILEAEEQIFRVTGKRTVGFRGPGFSWSSDLIQVLTENGYLYDASSLPTYIGPLARVYYFWTSDLTEEEKDQRKKLFGSFMDGMRPVKPYHWQVNSGSTLLEIPVTTIPVIKVPFHLSYLIYLSRFSPKLMSLYLKTALALCRLTFIEPSFLLHPLDLLGGDQVSELAFFPGMDLNSGRKRELFMEVIKVLSRNFDLVNMSAHAQSILKRDRIRVEHPS